MKLKVCGMRDSDNIRELMEVKPDFMGMIFYPKSSRYVEELPQTDLDVATVGVFVNESTEVIQEKSKKFGFQMVQLHGSESVEQAEELKLLGFKVIKVFGVMDQLPLEEMKPYESTVDYFLFDTKTSQHGGSGQKFDWSILESYDLDKPFFLSGGIDLEDLESIKALNIPQLYAVDINSRFERAPAVKDIQKIKSFKHQL
ncbi:MAG: N-(5'-phosphoribosyl)anthranilate isomerase [Flammeovirgaceae bacterium]|nr:N-(5'-phosphoribosyl)anthranilate isomerase [Flammeovirgaceae bacterium]MBE62440.1 N-(5'-phosphoribosyl)anthranilate isomerase [Flammeovirgaceae bacterium]HCX23622.1 N-(5'-phosphoribosyl)anthranilate isomerase [Cytophagales bacterium]|tara:strand:+ start:210 stop:809 length:600 start_codon:yes stop_codon:yes gene_type:complete